MLGSASYLRRVLAEHTVSGATIYSIRETRREIERIIRNAYGLCSSSLLCWLIRQRYDDSCLSRPRYHVVFPFRQYPTTKGLVLGCLQSPAVGGSYSRALSGYYENGIDHRFLHVLSFIRDSITSIREVDPANTNNIISDLIPSTTKAAKLNQASLALMPCVWSDVIW